jgi:hypothetical protein
VARKTIKKGDKLRSQRRCRPFSREYNPFLYNAFSPAPLDLASYTLRLCLLYLHVGTRGSFEPQMRDTWRCPCWPNIEAVQPQRFTRVWLPRGQHLQTQPAAHEEGYALLLAPRDVPVVQWSIWLKRIRIAGKLPSSRPLSVTAGTGGGSSNCASSST